MYANPEKYHFALLQKPDIYYFSDEKSDGIDVLGLTIKKVDTYIEVIPYKVQIKKHSELFNLIISIIQLLNRGNLFIFSLNTSKITKTNKKPQKWKMTKSKSLITSSRRVSIITARYHMTKQSYAFPKPKSKRYWQSLR